MVSLEKSHEKWAHSREIIPVESKDSLEGTSGKEGI